METPVVGEILLVGEGDFSFCVSMVNKLPTTQHASITSTSLETDDSILKHQDAVSNIKTLREKGVTVKLDTDATKIHEDPNFSVKKFARIIFNFPHTGGKSNHKKNRKLLKDFFASAKQMLDDQGQVFMTLCKGQGGTPADKPQRAWHDSWQVVSMAADADLILVKVVPFNADEYRVYSSTGFRSQDKGFNTDRAITHVFEVAKSVDIPQTIILPISIHGHVYLCPRYIFYKLNIIRSIRHNPCHPLHKLHTSLVKALSVNAEVCDLGMQPPIQGRLLGKQPTGSGPSPTGSQTSPTDSQPSETGSQTSPTDSQPSETGSQTSPTDSQPSETGSQTSPTDSQPSETGDKPCWVESSCSRYSFKICDVPNTIFGESEDTENFDDLTVVKDNITEIDVDCETVLSTEPEEKAGFRLISDDIDLTVVGELLESKMTAEIQAFYYPLFKTSKTYSPASAFTYCTVFVQSLSGIDREESTETRPTDKQNNSLRHQVEGAVNTLIKVYSDLLGRFKLKVNCDGLKDMVDNNDITLKKMYCIGIVDWLTNDHWSAEVCPGTPQHAPRQNIGNIYLFALCKDNLPVYYLVCKLDVCDLACARFGISDRRCLWSQDHRILSQFENLDISHEDALGDHKNKEPRNRQTTDCNTYTLSDKASSQHSNSGTVTEVCNPEKCGDQPFEETTLHTHTKSTLPTSSTGGKVFTTPSLYPLTNIHDMSFWENESILFDESVYLDVIRDVAGDNVTSVDLIDTFTCQASGRRSRCYRLVFQSADHVMSYNTSWKLQSMIRLEVEQCLKITLR